MATALDMIKRSMRLIKATGSGETPTADEQADGLTALNAMLDSWSIRNLNVYEVQTENFTWASGNASRTMGSGGDFDTARPIEIEGMYQRINSVDYPVRKATEQQYSGVVDKSTQTSLMTWFYPDMAYPLTTIYAYPVPSSNADVYIRSWKALQSFSSASTVLAMPPGYEDAIVFNLAVRLAPEYEREVPAMVFRQAVNTLRSIKQRNNRIPNAVIEVGHAKGNYFDWRTGV